MPKRSFRTALIIVLGSFLIVLAVAAYYTKQIVDYRKVRHGGTGSDIVVTIPEGASFPKVARILTESKLIEHPDWFRIYGMVRGVTTQVKKGRYTLKDNMTPEQILDVLIKGIKEYTFSVTIPEGLHMLEVFAILEAAQKEQADKLKKSDGLEFTVVTATEMQNLAETSEFLKDMKIAAASVEGYLFPDTYQMRFPSTAKAILETLIVRHREVWAKIVAEKPDDVEKIKKRMGWDEQEILTMASIVEKEAVVDSERPTIAQVFINRLVSPEFVPHKLDTDPTIRYGCTIPKKKSAGCQNWKITDRLRRAQLDDKDNPYNTYQHEGLPPGPIANPGEKSLRATVSPDGTDYFYFVAKDDHSHAFAKTKEEHERNVDKYMR